MSRQHLFLCNLLIVLVLMAGCSSPLSESGPSTSTAVASQHGTDVNRVPPTESELVELLKKQRQEVLWCVDKFDCYAGDDIAAWNAEKVDYKVLWETISSTVFEDVDVLCTESTSEVSYFTLSNGLNCDMYEDSLSLVITDEKNFLESTGGLEEVEKKLADTLSSFFNMELELSRHTETERIYSFMLNETPISDSGYGYRNGGFVPGAYMRVLEESDGSGAIFISFSATPKEKENTYSNAELVDESKIIQLCTADLMANYPETSVVLVIEDATLTYALDPSGDRFVPMVQLQGYRFDGEKWEANRIINALTGEIFWN